MTQIISFTFLVPLALLIPQKALLIHDRKVSNPEGLTKLAGLHSLWHFKDVLNHILIERVVGTKGHEKVREYIKSSMEELNWSVEEDSFTARTPPDMRQRIFTNIIAQLNPDADKYLVLSCHYDSKILRNKRFLGATDSAVPCAMMINLAKVMSKQLDQVRNTDLSLMLIFFDGEEAFVKWNETDSLYGSRHLAEKWHSTPYKSGNQLDRIDVLVLLDLLGANNPVFLSYFPNSWIHYTKLVSAEKNLSASNLLRNYNEPYFQDFSFPSFVEDDHTPFLKRNVTILHIIPSEFPRVWHTENDNMKILNFDIIENLNKILMVFVADYFQLDPML